MSALCDTQEPSLSGSFRPVSCTTAGGRCNKEESSAPLEERVNGGECTLLCIRGQYGWNVWVIKSLGGLVLFDSCHNGVFDSWENRAFVGPCQWHYTLLWMLHIASILHHAFFCAQGLSRIPSSFSLALLFVRLHIVLPAAVEAEGLAQNASSCWLPHSHMNSTVKHWLICCRSRSQLNLISSRIGCLQVLFYWQQKCFFSLKLLLISSSIFIVLIKMANAVIHFYVNYWYLSKQINKLYITVYILQIKYIHTTAIHINEQNIN